MNQNDTHGPELAPTESAHTVLDIDALYRTRRRQMLAVARRMVGAADAEDVVQQAFINAFQNAHSFRGQSKPSSWMYRVTSNTALMHLRSRRRKGAESLDALPTDIADKCVTMSREPVIGADAAVDRKATSDKVSQAMLDLIPLDQVIVEMRLADGFSTTEVADVTGISEGAVKSRLFRARKTLRTHLEGQALGIAVH